MDYRHSVSKGRPRRMRKPQAKMSHSYPVIETSYIPSDDFELIKFCGNTSESRRRLWEDNLGFLANESLHSRQVLLNKINNVAS